MIADFVNPVIHDTPNNLTLEANPGSSTVVVSWIEPTASDNSGHQTLTSNYHPGEYFSIGVTLVNYTSIDRSGNTDTRLFYVNIIGTFFNFSPKDFIPDQVILKTILNPHKFFEKQ